MKSGSVRSRCKCSHACMCACTCAARAFACLEAIALDIVTEALPPRCLVGVQRTAAVEEGLRFRAASAVESGLRAVHERVHHWESGRVTEVPALRCALLDDVDFQQEARKALPNVARAKNPLRHASPCAILLELSVLMEEFLEDVVGIRI